MRRDVLLTTPAAGDEVAFSFVGQVNLGQSTASPYFSRPPVAGRRKRGSSEESLGYTFARLPTVSHPDVTSDCSVCGLSLEDALNDTDAIFFEIAVEIPAPRGEIAHKEIFPEW